MNVFSRCSSTSALAGRRVPPAGTSMWCRPRPSLPSRKCIRLSSPSVRVSRTAPAPSPKKTQVRRSFQFMIFENASVPITSACRNCAGAVSIIPCATFSAKTKPLQTALTSNAGQALPPMPSFSWIKQATAGCD